MYITVIVTIFKGSFIKQRIEKNCEIITLLLTKKNKKKEIEKDPDMNFTLTEFLKERQKAFSEEIYNKFSEEGFETFEIISKKKTSQEIQNEILKQFTEEFLI